MAQVLHQAAQPKEQQDPPLCHFQERGAPCAVDLVGKRLFFPLLRDGKGPSLHMEKSIPPRPRSPVHRLRYGPCSCEQSCRNLLAGDGPR